MFEITRNERYVTYLVFTLGMAFSVTTAYIIQQRHVERVQSNFEAHAHDRILSLQRSIDTSVVIGKSIVALFQSSAVVHRSDFTSFVAGAFTSIPYIQAFEWVPKISEAERATLEQKIARYSRGFQFTERREDGTLARRRTQAQYFPVLYLEPYLGNEDAFGFDLGSNAARYAVLQRAEDSGSPTTTGRLDLVQGQSGQGGILMYFPTFAYNKPAATVSQRKLYLAGFVVLVFDINELVESSLKHLTPTEVRLSIFDENADPAEQLLCRHRSSATTEHAEIYTRLRYTDVVQVNDRSWRIEVTPAPGYYSTTVNLASALIFLVGLIGTVLLSVNLYLLRQRARDLAQANFDLERAVTQRTQELEKRNQELESFSYSIAHDLRSPLRAITGFSQILEEDACERLDATERSHLQRIVAAGKHMGDLIDDILKLSRISHFKMEPVAVDLSKVAYAIAERLPNKSDQGVEVVWRIQPEIIAYGDKSLLIVLLENLLGNALKFSLKQAEPVITFSSFQCDGIEVYRVKDNGAGFDGQYREKIFGVFQRLHSAMDFEGTGIGLATARRIVERHGGWIWSNSLEGKGATFYFTLGKSKC